MNFAEYVAYFEALAISNKAIGHTHEGRKSFRRIDIEEVLNGAKADMDGEVCMFLESPEIRTYDGLSDNPRKLMYGAFLIMKQADKGDYESQIAALDTCMQVSEQALAKIYNDVKKKTQSKLHPWNIAGFDPNSVQFEKVGPVFGYYYGWRMQFTINQTFSNRLVLNDAEWYNDTKFSI
jgi:hypothetical protein